MRFERAAALFRIVGLSLSGFAVLCMVGLVTADVVSRRFLGFSLLIADEVTGYLLIAVTFLGAAYTLSAGGFVRMELVYRRLRGKGRWVVDISIHLVSLGYLAIIAYWLGVYVVSSYRSGVTSISIAQTPLYIPRLFILLGVLLLMLEVATRLIYLLKSKGASEGPEIEE
jgi:TRAP-type C4-dicarboxylate transport system permease small subunit